MSEPKLPALAAVALPRANETADLPALYEAAKIALAACVRADELADVADKSAALAAYAAMAKDPALENYARRIRLRAVRRMGELLADHDARGGDRRSKNEPPPVFEKLSRRKFAEKAGLSSHEALTASRIAKIPAEEFEQAVETSPVPGTSRICREAAAERAPRTHGAVDADRTRLAKNAQELAEAVFAIAAIAQMTNSGSVYKAIAGARSIQQQDQGLLELLEFLQAEEFYSPEALGVAVDFLERLSKAAASRDRSAGKFEPGRHRVH